MFSAQFGATRSGSTTCKALKLRIFSMDTRKQAENHLATVGNHLPTCSSVHYFKGSVLRGTIRGRTVRKEGRRQPKARQGKARQPKARQGASMECKRMARQGNASGLQPIDPLKLSETNHELFHHDSPRRGKGWQRRAQVRHRRTGPHGSAWRERQRSDPSARRGQGGRGVRVVGPRTRPINPSTP